MADGVGRSIQLFNGFRKEGSDPGVLYGMLAREAVEEVGRYCPLSGAKILDVGGGSGYVGDEFRRAGAQAVTVEYDVSEMTAHGRQLRLGIAGDGCSLPLRSDVFDVTYSSNVLEHVTEPRAMVNEMIRVLRPGGVAYLAFTNWYSPWGGHETSPWHYLGGERAARRYERRYGHPAKNRFGRSLFPLHISTVLGWARTHEHAEVLDAYPRYYPRWTRPVVRVPGIREVATWNVVLVMRKIPA